jgi:putative SOS response-associated peptidase YedK
MIEEYFSGVSGEDDWNPRYNIAPTQSVPVIRLNPKEPVRQLSLMKWGLVPAWAKDVSGAASGNDQCRGGIGDVEALRCPTNEVLPG